VYAVVKYVQDPGPGGDRHKSAKGVLPIVIVSVLCSVLFSPAPLLAAGPDDDLMNRAKAVFGTLTASMPSPDNPLTPEKVKLGQVLFWEPRISLDGTVSCTKCHPFGLYAADGLRKAVGNNCKPNPRNSPCILNSASQISAHWIGNRTSVEDQARQAVTGPPAFGMPSNEAVEKVLKGMKGYMAMFKGAFPADKERVSVENLAKAIGAFERTLMTPGPFDDIMKGNAGALTAQQKRGLRSFLDAGCMTCHFSPYLGGMMYQKFGVFEPYERYTKSQPVDEGRVAVTKNPADRFLFKVPVLRNLAETPPFFHDGSVEKLEDAVVIMAKVQLMKDLTKEQTDDITAFLRSLTGPIPEAVLKVTVLPAAD
jgi:cytochrome c peroxidase